MILTYKFRACPTRQQHTQLAEILEFEWQLYNAALQERIDAYQRSLLEVERGRRAKPHTVTCYDQTNSITVLNNDPLTRADFAALPAWMHHWTLNRLDDAYKAFFRRVRGGTGKPGFPKFRSRDTWRSFGSRTQNRSPIRLDGNRILLSRLNCDGKRQPMRLRLHMHRPIPEGAVIKAAVFTRDAGGRKWHVCLQLEIPDEKIARRCQSSAASIGLDVGIEKAIAQSQGAATPLPKAIRSSRRLAKRRQRAFSRAQRGSKRRQKTKQRLARLAAKNTARRHHFQHQQAARLTRCYRTIGIEDLSIANMTRSAKGTPDKPGSNVKAKAGLNRGILEVGWGGFREKLEYKAQRDGAQVIAVNPRNTSQLCSGCGALVPKSLKQRVHRCPSCGLILDRDTNAARNILARALGALAQTSSAIAAGVGLPLGRVRPDVGRAVDPGNTVSESLPDGGGSNPASTRKPQARATTKGDPRHRDISDLPLFAGLAAAAPSGNDRGPRDRRTKLRRGNGLQSHRRSPHGDAD